MFDILNTILYKNKTLDTDSIEGNEEFQPFLMQRWCSMYSPEIANLLNQTSNRVWPILDSKEFWYKYLNSVVPPCRFKRITYIKKKKKEASAVKQRETLQKVASTLEISSREVSEYIEQFNLQLPDEKKSNDI